MRLEKNAHSLATDSPNHSELINSDPLETDEATIQQQFETLPAEQVTLLAINLARPDGFCKTLITKTLATSAELQKLFDINFALTHRGHYMSFPPVPLGGANEYLSFKIGTPQRMYGKTHIFSNRPWIGGLGFGFMANELLENEACRVSYGNLGLAKILNATSADNDPLLQELRQLSNRELSRYDDLPPKQDMEQLVHLARLHGQLNNDDQAEVNLATTTSQLPRLKVDRAVIFIPANQKEALLRLIRVKLSQMKAYADKLKIHFGIDLEILTAEKVLEQFNNIYWYPQLNIDLAVKYLSTHPKKIAQLLQKSASLLD